MNKKIIALIVTAGNRDISKTISSIESQTKKVDEIIIASEKDFASEYKVLVNPYKKGLARNTNQSLVRIKDLYPNENLYIATVDDDDL
jgi:glycosyltransferase involved in cell wall biosynthesis